MEAARDALAAGPPRWLGRDAVELVLPAPAPPGFDLRTLVAGVDVNLVPAGRREKRRLVADMDRTIVAGECIDELAAYAGVKPQVAAITEAAMEGRLDFEAALRARVALLRGLPESVLQECYDERVRLNPGARVLVRTMAARGAGTALVSGGFTFFAERVAAECGFVAFRANQLGVAGGRLTGEIEGPVLGRDAKRAALEDLAAAAAHGPGEAVAIGDGANDLAMLGIAGMGIAWRAKPAVAAAAGFRLEHSDLTAVLALQGVAREDFVG